jgi:hypothetical protein
MQPLTLRHCAAPGCTFASRDFSPLCPKHRKAHTRHGHYAQEGLQMAELRPYLRQVEAKHKASPDSPAWAILTDRWERLVQGSMEDLQAREDGRPFSLHHSQAAEELRNLAGAVGPLQVTRMALAVYLMREAAPHRFTSDRGFDFQLWRRVRGLAPTNKGTSWCHSQQRMRHVYRGTPVRVVEVLTAQLKEVFGEAGLLLARADAQKAWEAEQERERLDAALLAL